MLAKPRTKLIRTNRNAYCMLIMLMPPKVSEPLLNGICCINLDNSTCKRINVAPKLENNTQTGTIVYIVLLIIDCSTWGTIYILHTVYSRIKHMLDWILHTNRARAVPPFGVVQNTYRTRTVEYQSIYVCILFWKIIYYPKIWLINNTIIFNLIKSVSIINYNIT